MNICECYHLQAQSKWSGYGATSTTVYQGICWGTKECEPCSCDGDELKCDFYDYIRERAEKERLEYKIKEAIELLGKNGYKVENEKIRN